MLTVLQSGMARYSCVHYVLGPAGRIHDLLVGVFEPERFELIHDSPNYWVVRELPGQVSFDRLVTLEFLLDSGVDDNRIQVTCIAKNDALSLQRENYCRQVFDSVESIIKQLAPTSRKS
ncbi:MAG: hypothetical protein AAFY57_13465 [Cyanobacteria bacterium J06642_2]